MQYYNGSITLNGSPLNSAFNGFPLINSSSPPALPIPNSSSRDYSSINTIPIAILLLHQLDYPSLLRAKTEYSTITLSIPFIIKNSPISNLSGTSGTQERKEPQEPEPCNKRYITSLNDLLLTLSVTFLSTLEPINFFTSLALSFQSRPPINQQMKGGPQLPWKKTIYKLSLTYNLLSLYPRNMKNSTDKQQRTQLLGVGRYNYIPERQIYDTQQEVPYRERHGLRQSLGLEPYGSLSKACLLRLELQN